MTTFRISYVASENAWSVLESGRRIRLAGNKRQAKNVADRRARVGDTIITERKNGTVMSEREIEPRTLINSDGDGDNGDDNGGLLGLF